MPARAQDLAGDERRFIQIFMEDAAIVENVWLEAQFRWQDLDGADDSIGFGPVFPTKSKPNPASVKGITGLTEVCAAVEIPVVAIGGMTLERVRSVLDVGAHGVAVMSAVVMAQDPRNETERFRKAIDHVNTQIS